MNTSKKITLATVKSFIKKNFDNLHINVKSSFDGMTDGCEMRKAGFVTAIKTEDHKEHTQGIEGAWFVGSSRDYFNHYEDENFTGIEVYNSCGRFLLAVKR